MTNTPQLRWTAAGILFSSLLFFPLDYGQAARRGSGLRLNAAAAAPEFPAPTGDRTSRADHLERLGVTAWHKAGHDGLGVKVLVLDTGFSDYRDHLGHALPAQVTVKSFRTDGNLEAKASQHGILCAEVVHALAPAADLLLAN